MPRHYVFRCASDVADWPIWLGNCPRGALRDKTSKPDRTEKWAGGNISLVLQYVLNLTLPDGQDMQCPPGTVFFALARSWPSEMKITKIRWTVILGRPSGMRGGGGRGYGEGMRSLQGVCCVSVDCRLGFHTPAPVYDKGGGSFRAFRLSWLEPMGN